MNLRYELSDHIGIFTLDNPPVNVWTPELHKRFSSCCPTFCQTTKPTLEYLPLQAIVLFLPVMIENGPTSMERGRACRALPQWDA